MHLDSFTCSNNLDIGVPGAGPVHNINLSPPGSSEGLSVVVGSDFDGRSSPFAMASRELALIAPPPVQGFDGHGLNRCDLQFGALCTFIILNLTVSRRQARFASSLLRVLPHVLNFLNLFHPARKCVVMVGSLPESRGMLRDCGTFQICDF